MKDIPGYEGLYAVSPGGMVWAYPRTGKRKTGGYRKEGKWLVASVYKDYPLVSLYDAFGKPEKYYVHRLVAEAFLQKLQVNHKNGIKTDNRVENLEWVTPSQNMLHARQVLLVGNPRGERAWAAKLTDDKVREIRRLHSERYTNKSLSEMFGVDNSVISRVVNRQTWTHVE